MAQMALRFILSNPTSAPSFPAWAQAPQRRSNIAASGPGPLPAALHNNSAPTAGTATLLLVTMNRGPRVNCFQLLVLRAAERK